MENETTKQVYKFICDFIAQNGLPPSVREIATHCYLAPSSVNTHLRRLQEQGFIIRARYIARGITLPAQLEK